MKSRDMVTVLYSSNKISSVTGVGTVCRANSIVINTNTNQYNINVD